MKRIVTGCLIALMLTTNYAYATLSIQEVSPAIEAALSEKQVQQQIEELFAEIIMSIMEGEGTEGLSLNELAALNMQSQEINPNQEFTGNPIYDLILVLVYGVSFIVQLAGSLLPGIVSAVTWVVQVLVSIFLNVPQVLVGLVSFTVNVVLAVVEIVFGLSSNLLIYLIPLILTVLSIIIDDLDIVL